MLIVGLLTNDNGEFLQVSPFSSSNQDFFLFGFVFLEFVSRTVAVGDRPLSGLFHRLHQRCRTTAAHHLSADLVV